MSDTPLGRLCWYECLTADLEGAKAFYPKVTGWGTAEWDGGDMPYTMWTVGETPMGGVMVLPEEAKAMGAPPHWLLYVSTPDLDATAEKATALGATVLNQMDVPEVGRFGIISDPQGAVFAAFEPAGDTPGTDGTPQVGQASWHELLTTDWQAAWSFYSELLGWSEDSQMEMGDMGTYHMFNRGAHPLGGMMNRPPEMPVTAWLVYFKVANIEDAVAHTKENGGQVLNGPMEVPGGDLIAQCMDPQGATFALHQAVNG